MRYCELSVLASSVAPEHRSAYLYYLTEKSAPELMLDGREMPKELEIKAKNALEEHLSGIPLQYIFGYTWFYGLKLFCDRNVLIPQPDTEVLVEEAVKNLPYGAHFADICTGSGCIAAAVLTHRPDTLCTAYDISDYALATARKNNAEHISKGRCSIKKLDVFAPWEDTVFDALISNPPYIKSADIDGLDREVLSEPRLALDGGADGLDFYRRILDEGKRHLRSGGHIYFETGHDTAEGVKELCRGKYPIRQISDLSKIIRVADITVE